MTAPTTILLGEYGSRAHGTNTEFSDRDSMGIAIEPMESALGIDSWDGARSQTAIEGERSMAGDVDVVIYSLRKWARLAAKGNPTVLMMLFLPDYEVRTAQGGHLLGHRDLFVSKAAGSAFLRYMQSQREAMTGIRNKRTNRPELVHLHGYDTKFAHQMIRLGLQGAELMNTGAIRLPVPDDRWRTLMDVREGKITREDVLALSFELEADLEQAQRTAALPEEVDRVTIDELLIELHLDAWSRS